MFRNRLVKIKSAALAMIIFFSLITPTITGFADALTLNEAPAVNGVQIINPSQSQINKLRAEKKEYERRKTEVQEKIDATGFELQSELGKKEVLDERILLTSLEIENINETIDQFYLLIREKEYEVHLAQGREETQLQKYRTRVRDMEENGIISYLEIIFDSTSFSDLLARLDFIVDIMRSDEKTYSNLQAARTETEAIKADLEETKDELDIEKEQLDEKKIELDEQLKEAHEMILKLEDDIEAEQALYDLLVDEEERVQNAINVAVAALRRQQALDRQRRERELQRQRELQGNTGNTANNNTTGENTTGENTTGASPGNENNSGTGGTGQFMWPMNGPILSRFGPRSGRMHSGLDIGGPHGASVVAAESGTVITVSHQQSYGNYVAISHGNGITTLYAHLTSSSVKRGDYVTRGQQIGLNGSTGNATAPHVHFEVSVNGTRVNPEPYLS